ncbi:MAG: LLM class flavin-dependent oxidoreductase [Solirubrobacteraceae bacterium]
MRVGIYTDMRNPPRWARPWAQLYARTLERIEAAERDGIDSVWVSEHHLFADGYLPQPLTLAAAIAARTRRMRIGTAVLLAPLRPALQLAEEAAVVDLISDGRLELGLGAGYRVPEFDAYGVPVEARFPLLERRAGEVLELFAGGTCTPPPVQQPPPLWLGVMGPRGARIAGRLGAGLLWLSQSLLAPYRHALAEAGHDARRARMGGLVNVLLADDPEAAWRQIAPHVAYQRESYESGAAEGRRDDDGPAVRAFPASTAATDELLAQGPRLPERRLSSRLQVLTAQEALEVLEPHLAPLPVTDVFFWIGVAGMADALVDRHLELLARELAPALRRRAAAVPAGHAASGASPSNGRER